MSKLSKIEKKKRVEIIQAQETAELIATMPLSIDDLNSLLDHLDVALESCDHSSIMTKSFLRSRKIDEEKAIPWLEERGGYCDCEVLANLEDLAESLKDRPQRNEVRPKKKIGEPRGLKLVAGFDLSSLPKPWHITNLFNHEEPIEIQLGKKTVCSITIVDEPLPEGDRTSEEYWVNMWCLRTDLPQKEAMNTLFNSIVVPTGFGSICVSTKGWIPVLCWIFQQDSNSYIEVTTELSRKKGDLSEVEKLIRYLDGKKA